MRFIISSQSALRKKGSTRVPPSPLTKMKLNPEKPERGRLTEVTYCTADILMYSLRQKKIPVCRQSSMPETYTTVLRKYSGSSTQQKSTAAAQNKAISRIISILKETRYILVTTVRPVHSSITAMFIMRRAVVFGRYFLMCILPFTDKGW